MQAALTGVVPTTEVAQAYTDPAHPGVELWDMPSFDVPGFGAAGTEQHITDADLLVLVVSVCRLNQESADALLRKIAPYHRPCVIAATKVDDLVAAHGVSAHASVKERFQEICARASTPLYVVTARADSRDDADFCALCERVFTTC